MYRGSNLILDVLSTCPEFRGFCSLFPEQTQKTSLGHLPGSLSTIFGVALNKHLSNQVSVFVAPSPLEVLEIETDLDTIVGRDSFAVYPQREQLPQIGGESDHQITGMQIEALETILTGKARLLVTTIRALQERAHIPDSLDNLRVTLRVGSDFGFSKLVECLQERGFRKSSLVEEIGQYSVRGGVIDVFSFGTREPFRVEFDYNKISSIRFFDLLSQRSDTTIPEAQLLPVNFQGDTNKDSFVHRSLIELLPSDTIMMNSVETPWGKAFRNSWETISMMNEQLSSENIENYTIEELMLQPAIAEKSIAEFPRINLRSQNNISSGLVSEKPPVINRNMKALLSFLNTTNKSQQKCIISCDNIDQLQRLEEILGGPKSIPDSCQLMVGALSGGFSLPSTNPPLHVLTHREIFNRIKNLSKSRRFRGSTPLESLAQLKSGDYVVHRDHGIGIFRNLNRVKIQGQTLESLAIEYAGDEVLQLPIHRLDRIEKWGSGLEDDKPTKLHRIGGKRWDTLKKRTIEHIENITVDLLRIYAERKNSRGHQFSPDTAWQKEMESSFLHEDTPDQRLVTEEVKRDMESSIPMDRLICADVGFGKTEVAVRAAFKAAQDGKQVAVLVPTTILAEQHYETFTGRLATYPVTIGLISRFTGHKKRKQILDGIATSKIDIIIGTHRLLSKDVSIPDIGLLIIDEEQRFGVKHKERLKELKTSIDVLTLTATPIPRTMQLSLSGIRNLSLIQTPPQNRMPILTYTLPWSDSVITLALQRELDRGGQAFFLHNLVSDIGEIAQKVQRLVPKAKIAIAHGQMSAQDLNGVMHSFMNNESNILVCSSIIENGLDVPNANTVVIDGADRFGLSQLHQIRGRVGRSHKRAFCYLITPPKMKENTKQRLKTLTEYTELGSGYSVALRDLKLRGAGNLLGGDQSGFAHAVGISTYVRMVEETVASMKDSVDHPRYPATDISTSRGAYLPDEYISDDSQKLQLYSRISKLGKVEEVTSLREEILDRFGKLPEPVENLLVVTQLRIMGQKLGIETLLFQERKVRLNFNRGVLPKLSLLEEIFLESGINVEIRRLTPLSIVLRAGKQSNLLDEVVRSIETLLDRIEETAH